MLRQVYDVLFADQNDVVPFYYPPLPNWARYHYRRMPRGVDQLVEIDRRAQDRGIKLIKGLMDDVRIERTDDGTRITMVKVLRRDDV
ncbi:MAG TPA: ATP-binding protein [Pyrinomonadaceae bacterium]|nr:ATP-binding protein [Pyrinomonadaceae bacterium]